MASAMLQHLTAGHVLTDSAGVIPGSVDPFMVAVMDEIGIDLSNHQPKYLREIADQDFDLIISLSPEAHHHAIELTRVMAAEVHYWQTLDVAQMEGAPSRLERLNRYRTLRDTVFDRVKQEFAITGGPNV
ncbi:MAG: hypothetical protein K0U34_06630 [Alphaproteobacteria bacterium]|nr:hypothetical protein [Alphaproteobacteria bacterium]